MLRGRMGRDELCSLFYDADVTAALDAYENHGLDDDDNREDDNNDEEQ